MPMEDEFRFRCTEEFKARFDEVCRVKGHPWDRSKLAVEVLTKYCEREEKALGIEPPKTTNSPKRSRAVMVAGAVSGAERAVSRAKSKPKRRSP